MVADDEAEVTSDSPIAKILECEYSVSKLTGSCGWLDVPAPFPTASFCKFNNLIQRSKIVASASVRGAIRH
jgi:hypothetical protein